MCKYWSNHYNVYETPFNIVIFPELYSREFCPDITRRQLSRSEDSNSVAIYRLPLKALYMHLDNNVSWFYAIRQAMLSFGSMNQYFDDDIFMYFFLKKKMPFASNAIEFV